MSEIEKIKELCCLQKVQFTDHALKRILQRNIDVTKDVLPAILSAEIIEEYADDYPYKSYLLLGRTEEGKAMHIVCAIGDDILWIITEYVPNNIEWEDDYKTRRIQK